MDCARPISPRRLTWSRPRGSPAGAAHCPAPAAITRAGQPPASPETADVPSCRGPGHTTDGETLAGLHAADGRAAELRQPGDLSTASGDMPSGLLRPTVAWLRDNWMACINPPARWTARIGLRRADRDHQDPQAAGLRYWMGRITRSMSPSRLCTPRWPWDPVQSRPPGCGSFHSRRRKPATDPTSQQSRHPGREMLLSLAIPRITDRVIRTLGSELAAITRRPRRGRERHTLPQVARPSPGSPHRRGLPLPNAVLWRVLRWIRR